MLYESLITFVFLKPPVRNSQIYARNNNTRALKNLRAG